MVEQIRRWPRSSYKVLTEPTQPDASNNTYPAYRLGDTFETFYTETDDATNWVLNRYMYVYASISLIANVTYIISYTNTPNQEYTPIVPATLSSSQIYIPCVPMFNMSVGEWGFVQIKGNTSAQTTADTVLVGDYLRLVQGSSNLISQGGGSYDEYAMAIANEGGTAISIKTILLLGKPVGLSA